VDNRKKEKKRKTQKHLLKNCGGRVQDPLAQLGYHPEASS